MPGAYPGAGLRRLAGLPACGSLTRPNLAAVPAGLPFLDTLAAHCLERAGPDPLALSRALVLLPTRRAVRALGEAFLRQTDGRALLLPRIVALGAVDEAPLALEGALSLPPAIEPMQRLAILARLVLALGGRHGAPRTAERAWTLAAELARLLDEAQRCEVDLAAALPGAAAAAFAEHWQVTLGFLEIVTRAWPVLLAERGRMDPAARQVALLRVQAAAWRATPPAHDVIAAGSTGAIASVARLLRTVSLLPHGLVVLPGFDASLWPDAAHGPLPESHPQAGMQRLLAGMDAGPGDVAAWRGPAHVATHAAVPGGREALLRLALLPAGRLAAWRAGADGAAGGAAAVAGAGVAGLRRLVTADQQEEATAVALILRGALEQEGSRAALVTPDRELAARVVAELLRFGVVVDDSAGEPLALTPPAVFLRLLAHAVAQGMAPVPLLAVLKHPLCAAGMAPAACRAAARLLELACLRGPRPGPGLTGLREALAGAARSATARSAAGSSAPRAGTGGGGAGGAGVVEEAGGVVDWTGAGSAEWIGRGARIADAEDGPAGADGSGADGSGAAGRPADGRTGGVAGDQAAGGGTSGRVGARARRVAGALLDRVEGCVAPLLALEAEALPDLGLEALVRAGEALAATDAEDGAHRLWAAEDGAALSAHLAELAEALAPGVGGLGPQPAQTLPGLLEASMEGIVVRSRRALRGRDGTEHPRLFIWGLLEARLQSLDLIVLGGLAEDVWPRLADPGPWMSRAMRATVGLGSPEAQVGQDAHDFAAVCCAAPEVVLSCPRRRDGAPAVPSRWLVRLDALLAGSGLALAAHPAAGWAQAMDRPDGAARPVSPPAPRPPLALRPRRLSVTEIETWLRDPYAIYARHVLRLRALPPLEESADAADYGSVVHGGLAAFLGEVGTAWPADASRRLARAVDLALDERALRPALAAWWRPRLARIAAWVADAEAERRAAAAPGRVDAEVSGLIRIAAPGGPFELRGRADRIERHGDGVSILDYKTGEPPSGASVAGGWTPQLTLEAAMALRGAFGPELAGEVMELAYWQLSGGFEPGKAHTLFGGQTARMREAAEQAWESLCRRVQAFDDPDCPYLSQPHPGEVPRFSDYAQLARVAEWAVLDDAG